MRGPMILLIAGAVLVLLTGGVLLVSLLLPIISDGKTSWEEAMFGIIPGGACCGFSSLLVLGGLIWMVANKNKQH